jgi:hypothetical protein
MVNNKERRGEVGLKKKNNERERASNKKGSRKLEKQKIIHYFFSNFLYNTSRLF